MSGSRPPRSFRYASRTDSGVYTRLFSVTVTHSYYTQDKGLCPDFRVFPSPSSAKAMRALGLLLRNEGTGFSVLIRPDALPNLLNYIRYNAQDPSGKSGFWSRLTFLMVAVNPLFVGITALPIDTKPTAVNFYCCNTQAHPQDAQAVLSQGEYVDGDALYPVVGTCIAVTVPPQTRFVTLTDISGAVVETWKVPVPEKKEATVWPLSVSLDLSDLGYDFYTIGLADENHKTVEASDYPQTVLYVPADPLTMGMLDILFTQPTPDSAGIYPLSPVFDPDDTAQIADVAYVLPFDARPTYWQYYVVSQSAGGSLSNLKIQGSGAKFRQQRQPVLLPDGSSATLFRALTTLPLRQKSAERFQLTGQRQDANGHTTEIMVSALPVAPSAPVWPGPPNKAATGTSEMFIYV